MTVTPEAVERQALDCALDQMAKGDIDEAIKCLKIGLWHLAALDQRRLIGRAS